ncbi:hypothetical protein TEQG_03755 [Trichophyton equinum CBS 127.97]|uniref:Uncharacterized protein n=1 Tax=Trichophyton equinum (strain ATCC MYA-4606 / CBS 127.97) TaxID=559882 RepID=F2PSP3_TRIEC|nr:hypothetical protein TEQG_03755 [Trichophyton equinum CBS 127.97]
MPWKAKRRRSKSRGKETKIRFQKLLSPFGQPRRVKREQRAAPPEWQAGRFQLRAAGYLESIFFSPPCNARAPQHLRRHYNRSKQDANKLASRRR